MGDKEVDPLREQLCDLWYLDYFFVGDDKAALLSFEHLEREGDAGGWRLDDFCGHDDVDDNNDDAACFFSD